MIVRDMSLLLNAGDVDYNFELALAELVDNAIQATRVQRIPRLWERKGMGSSRLRANVSLTDVVPSGSAHPKRNASRDASPLVQKTVC